MPILCKGNLHPIVSSYDSCDLGTLKNQTNPDGSPVAAAGLSYQPGQKLSACTCKDEEHPGPSNKIGRGGPEIDILEVSTQIHNGVKGGEVSQSAQFAPYGKSTGDDCAEDRLLMRPRPRRLSV